MKSVKYYIVLILFIIGLIFVLRSCDAYIKYNEIQNAQVIIVNGEEYNTEDIKEFKEKYDGFDVTYVITFYDGVKLRTKNYSLRY